MEHHSASPAPAGLVSFAVACFTFFGIYSGLVNGPAALPLLACWLLGAFFIQFIVALRELDHGALLGGNVFLYFSGFFCLATVFSLLTKTIFPGLLGIALDTKIEGFAWIPCTLALILWTPAYFKTSNGCMGLLVAFTDVALVFLTLKDLGLVSGPTVNALIAYPLLVAGVIGVYVCGGIQLNAAFGRQVLNLLPPLIKTKESVHK
jgi:succinate-acetate transporter protein